MSEQECGKNQVETSHKFWERAAIISKISPLLLMLVGGIAGIAVAVSQIYLNSLYETMGTSAGHLNLQLLPDDLLGWLLIVLAVTALWPYLLIFGLFIVLIYIGVTFLDSFSIRKSSSPTLYAWEGIILGSIYVIIALFYPTCSLITRMLWGMTGTILFLLSLSLLEILPKIPVKIIDGTDSLVRIILIVSVVLVVFVILLSNLFITAEALGRQGGWTAIRQSPGIKFSTSRPLDITASNVITSTGFNDTIVYEGYRLLFRTSKEYYLYTSTIMDTVDLQDRKFPIIQMTSVQTQGCSPAKIEIIPASEIKLIELIPMEDSLDLPCGKIYMRNPIIFWNSLLQRAR